MTAKLLAALAAYIPHDRVMEVLEPARPLSTDGVALIADISGFTPLTEALTQGLRPDQGAEELTRALESVFAPLIDEIHRFRGAVIKFGGDALIVWFGRRPYERRTTVARRALTAAWRMQTTMASYGRVPTPIGSVTLRMKIGLAYGPVRRFVLGQPAYGYEDVLVGDTLDRMAAAEHHTQPGEIVTDQETLALVPGVVEGEWREGFVVVKNILRPARPSPWPPLIWPETEVDGLRQTMMPYVPGPIVETLMTGRAQIAELKPVVSLFVQFHGLDYDSDPAVGQKLQSYFVVAQEVVNRYGGRLNRLITGDKGSLVHVIFGAPRVVEEQEERAVRCALELLAEGGRLPFITSQRMGISLGRVFAGPVGSPARHDYTVMGDAVNLSARLMQQAADNQILLEKGVREQLGPEFQVSDLGQMQVKGKAEPITVFVVEGVGERPRRQHPQKLPPLFGREEETAVLRRHIVQLAGGQGGIVEVIGDVGLGKTLLLDHLQAWVEGRSAGQFSVSRPDTPSPPILWASGMSLAYGPAFSGYLFITLLRDLLDLPPGAGPVQTAQQLHEFCADLFGRELVETVYPYLARFMGLALTGEMARRLEGLSGESLRWRLFELVPDLFHRLSARQPVVLALDDVQWIDPTSRQLLAQLEPVTADVPLLLLLVRRPTPESGLAQNVVSLVLKELDRTSAVALITHFAPTLPAHVVNYLVEKGGGNPLFLVEMMRTLQTQGMLAADVDLTGITLDALDLPNSVQGLLLAQLDRLAAEARHTLQLASVIGKTFLHDVLAAISDAAQELDERLHTLETRDFIQPAGATHLGRAHQFRHLLIQESAYSTLLYERRRAYHRQVAQALEQLFPAAIAEQAPFLAHHYEQAADLEQAIYYWQQTADQARLLYAHEEAETIYHKILGLLQQQEMASGQPDFNRQAKTYLKLAQVGANRLDFEMAQQFYERAFILMERAEPAADQPGPGTGLAVEPVFRWGLLEQYAQNFDPALVENLETLEIVANLFEGLVELDNEWNIVPALARRWHIDEDGRCYRFELRANLRWSDGTPLTAHDFVFAWRRNLDPQTGSSQAYQLYAVEGAEDFHQGRESDQETIGIRALDDVTLEIRLRAPVNYFLYLLAFHVAFPQPAHAVTAYGTAWGNPANLVSNGAFQVAAVTMGKSIRLSRNRFYRGFYEGDLQQVDLRPLPAKMESFANDEIDWCRVDDRADLPMHYPDEAVLVQGFLTFFLGFACQCSPFDQKQVRQAFAHSVDRHKLVQTVWAGVQKPATGGIVPPGMPGHSPEIGLGFQPEQARQLLAEAGFADGHGLPPLTLVSLPGFGDTPAYLQTSWQEHLHVTVQVRENVATDEALADLHAGRAQIILLGWYLTYPDPDDILRGVGHGRSVIGLGWRSHEFDSLVEQAATLINAQERFAHYHEADILLTREEAAVVPLYYLQAYGLLRSRFRLASGARIIRDGNIKFKNIVVNRP